MSTLVLSDLHLGNGGSYDIFAGETELPKLLASLVGQQVHVLLNGDTFDFLMNDEPLALSLERANSAATALVEYPPSRAVLQQLGAIVNGGGTVTFRSGNHDLEIGLPSVQALIRNAMGNPPSGIAFSAEKQPLVVPTKAGSVLVAHGESSDLWNRFVHADVRADNAAFRYPPGSKLVKTIINRLKKDRGMRFVDLLKPDFSGAVLAALAVEPSAVTELGRKTTGNLVYQLVKRKLVDPDAFAAGTPGDRLPSAPSAVDAAGLTEDEWLAIESLADEVAQPDGFLGDELLRSALRKVGTAALTAYAFTHRMVAGEGSKSYFLLTPDASEWKAARELGKAHGAAFVITGHTHSARWARDADFAYLNTGTWIHLMRLPAPTAPAQEWAEFLALLKSDPGLSGAAKACLEQHFTCALIDETTGPRLMTWNGEGLVDLEPTQMAS